MDAEKRLMDVELKLTAQDDLLDTLNKTVYRQQKKIDELENLCVALAKRLKEMGELAAANAAGAPINERPPHY
jgi:SlyX protein